MEMGVATIVYTLVGIYNNNQLISRGPAEHIFLVQKRVVVVAQHLW